MLKCTIVGDVMPGARGVREKADLRVVKGLEDSHIVLGNLESPVVREAPKNINTKKIPLWSTIDNISVIKKFKRFKPSLRSQLKSWLVTLYSAIRNSTT